MRTLGLIALLLLLATSCQKETNQATVTKDCTGTYVDIGNKHYRVCNGEILNHIDQNEKINITYEIIDNCSSNDAICALYHAYDEDITIHKLK